MKKFAEITEMTETTERRFYFQFPISPVVVELRARALLSFSTADLLLYWGNRLGVKETVLPTDL